MSASGERRDVDESRVVPVVVVLAGMIVATTVRFLARRAHGWAAILAIWALIGALSLLLAARWRGDRRAMALGVGSVLVFLSPMALLSWLGQFRTIAALGVLLAISFWRYRRRDNRGALAFLGILTAIYGLLGWLATSPVGLFGPWPRAG